MTTEEFSWELIWPDGARSLEWSHSGCAVLPDGRVAFAAPEGRDLIAVHPDSGDVTWYGTPALEIHGIDVDLTDGGAPTLWLADPGSKPRSAEGYAPEMRSGRVIAFNLDGSCRSISQPDEHPGGRGPWRPTSVVATSDGRVWVADGYGASLIQVFDRDGRHLFAIDGVETGAHLKCPHGLAIDTRTGRELVAVADRGNQRVIYFTLDGKPDDIVGDPRLGRPSYLAPRGDDLVVTDLAGGLTAVDRDGRVRSLVANLDGDRTKPWPNERRNGTLVRPQLKDDVLHSPHGVAVGADHSIYVTEWLIGGRQLRLRPH